MKPTWESDCGTVKLWLGDCLKVPELSEAAMAVLDPPYELIAAGAGIGARRKYLSDIEGFTDGGFDLRILDRFDNWACFCAKSQLVDLLAKAAEMPRWMLSTWNKPNPTPLCNGNYLPDTEYIVHGFQPGRCFGTYRDKSRYIVHPAQQNNHHPNEKPLNVVSKFVSLGSQNGELVADGYMGSGTTGVAAVRLGRNFYGCEIDPTYFEIAKKRIIAELNRFPLLEGVETKATQRTLGIVE